MFSYKFRRVCWCGCLWYLATYNVWVSQTKYRRHRKHNSCYLSGSFCWRKSLFTSSESKYFFYSGWTGLLWRTARRCSMGWRMSHGWGDTHSGESKRPKPRIFHKDSFQSSVVASLAAAILAWPYHKLSATSVFYQAVNMFNSVGHFNMEEDWTWTKNKKKGLHEGS